MGDCTECPQRNGFYPNGLVVEEVASITRPLDSRRWAKAEERTAEIISHIQPNRPSENHRNAIASYVQRLVSSCVPCQVFTFGSVPLKTYLPDGDIDLTAFSEDPNLKDNWAEEVQDMLQKEENNEHAEFPVKEVQLIQAEVRIIKCLVDNIVVDISFNQLGGLCTLCFLEEVDNFISQNHLFKRSIILIKAWCYYESRVLGAHHGLISTYALETLVLYIFHVFNNSFSGPLEVLYRFLDFFSKFDWANFCVSLWGPVTISSLPNMTADPPRKDGEELLLSKMFLNACGKAYLVSLSGPENQENHFSSKHLNIIDPLRLNNNLGRSVNKGNFYRIRSAFSLGAQKLAKLLECPLEDIVPELNQFFVNTWDRHGQCCRSDAPVQDFNSLELDVDDSHQSLSRLPGSSSLSPAASSIDSHKDLSSPGQKDIDESRSQMSSGGGHYSTERSKLWKKQHDVIKRTCMMNILQNGDHTKHHFARMSSSPELMTMSCVVPSPCGYNVATEQVNDDTNSRSGYPRENHVTNRFTDEPSIRESSSHRTLSNSISSSTTPSVSSRIQHYGGHGQMPINLASYSFIPFPPSAMGYNQQNYGCVIPRNAVEYDWGTMMSCSNGPLSAPFHQQIRPFSYFPEQENMTEGVRERAVPPGVDHVNEDFGSWIDKHSNGEVDPESEDFSTVGSRLSPASPSASSRTKASSESSWDGKATNMTNLSRYPLGKNGISGTAVNNGWEEDGEPVDPFCEDVNDDHKDWVHLSADESVARSVTTSPVECQSPVCEQPQISCQNSSSPFVSLPVYHGSHQAVVHNHAVLPVALYHTGSPEPFVTMVPVCSLPDTCASNNVIVSGKHSDEFSSDIFNSDFDRHWKNLLYGRFCQDSQVGHPFAYSPSVPVQALPLQRTSSVVSPGRPDAFGHIVPVSAHQPGSVEPVGVSRQYAGEFSKERNGTGTYFPNPNIIKERQSPTPRQYRGDGHDKYESHRDREANWNVKSKPRFGGRGQYRNYNEKQNAKIDRSATSISQIDKTWDTLQENSSPLNCLSKWPSPSNSTQRIPDVVDYSVYQVDSVHNNEVSSAGENHHCHVMLYPYSHPGGYGSWTENLQFGSVRPEHFMGTQLQEFNGY